MPTSPGSPLSFWDPIPFGIEESGPTVLLTMPEHSLLLGGEPGGGKSSALNIVTATAALDPAVRLWLLDPKRVELAPWARCANGAVSTNVADAVSLLRLVQAGMDERYELLLASRRRKIELGDGLGFDVIVCDELAVYMTSGTKADRTEFAELLRDVLSRGRASGHVVVVATQKPSTDVVPSSLRDLCQYRLATRCATPQMSDTVLGAGWASLGFSASTIDPKARGVGLLLADGREPVLMRSFYLDDEVIFRLARRAEVLRGAGIPGAG